MGVDDAIELRARLKGSDQFAIAKALAAYLKDKPFDLILAGDKPWTMMQESSDLLSPSYWGFTRQYDHRPRGRGPRKRSKGVPRGRGWEEMVWLFFSCSLHLPERFE